MREEQVDELIVELRQTRESFNKAIEKVNWHRVNTAVLYSLLAVVFFLGATVYIQYRNDQQQACERGNRLREAVVEAQDIQATAIGAAIAEVAHSSAEDLQQYLEIYDRNETPEALLPRDC